MSDDLNKIIELKEQIAKLTEMVWQIREDVKEMNTNMEKIFQRLEDDKVQISLLQEKMRDFNSKFALFIGMITAVVSIIITGIVNFIIKKM